MVEARSTGGELYLLVSCTWITIFKLYRAVYTTVTYLPIHVTPTVGMA